MGSPRSMLRFAASPPNLLSLGGLTCALFAIYFAVLRIYPAAMIGLVWAVAFDWFDGRVARSMLDRTDDERAYGANLDSLIDVVSFGVAPAVLLLAIGDFSPWFLPGAAIVLAAGVTRLSYFNVFGLVGGSTYRGLALDNNALILVAIFGLMPQFTAFVFAMIVYGALMVLAALNVAPISTPKLGGKWYYAVVAYAVAMTALFSWQLVVRAG